MPRSALFLLKIMAKKNQKKVKRSPRAGRGREGAVHSLKVRVKARSGQRTKQAKEQKTPAPGRPTGSAAPKADFLSAGTGYAERKQPAGRGRGRVYGTRDVEKEKNMIMWSGVSFFMLLVAFFWVQGLKSSISRGAENTGSGQISIQSLDEATEDFRKSLDEALADAPVSRPPLPSEGAGGSSEAPVKTTNTPDRIIEELSRKISSSTAARSGNEDQ